ncbi:hypothetical protein J6590_006743 [Homalodisca vitripennis]|nr:hypothetical protein J6590_006743 [Homalodisca vitripennis]
MQCSRLTRPLCPTEGCTHGRHEHCAQRWVYGKVLELHTRGNIINAVFTVDTIIMPHGRCMERLYARETRTLCSTMGVWKGAGVTYTRDYYTGCTHVRHEHCAQRWVYGKRLLYRLYARETRTLCSTMGVWKGAGVTYTRDYYTGCTHVRHEHCAQRWVYGKVLVLHTRETIIQVVRT